MSYSLGNQEVVLEDDAMIVTETDEKGNIIFASRDFCRISGYDETELMGKKHNIVKNPKMPKETFTDLWKQVTSGNNWSGIVVNKTKDGGFYWVNATVYASKRRDGSDKYISVRVKPSQEEIQKARQLYNI